MFVEPLQQPAPTFRGSRVPESVENHGVEKDA